MIQKYLDLIDSYLNKIPGHIQDIAAKSGIALAAIAVLFAVGTGWKKGSGSAQPKGLQMAKNTEDVLGEEIQKLKQRKKNRKARQEDSFEFVDEESSSRRRFSSGDYNRMKRKEAVKHTDGFRDFYKSSDDAYVPGSSDKDTNFSDNDVLEDNHSAMFQEPLKYRKTEDYRHIQRRQKDYLDDRYESVYPKKDNRSENNFIPGGSKRVLSDPYKDNSLQENYKDIYQKKIKKKSKVIVLE